MISNMHALRRTSPKGEAFIGVCRQCGQELPLSAMQTSECPNPRNLTYSESLLKALEEKQ